MNDTLQPGRELDALVAEKVMGLKNIRRITDPMTQTAFGDMIYEAEKPDPYPENAGVWLGHCVRVPHYSTDMIEAIKVWDVFSTLGWSLDRHTSGAWIISKEVQMEGTIRIAIGRSPEQVICLAALKAVGAY